MIDHSRCTAPQNSGELGGPRCHARATHDSIVGLRCAKHAEDLRCAFRNPNTIGNIVAGNRARTEAEIAKLVVELPPCDLCIDPIDKPHVNADGMRLWRACPNKGTRRVLDDAGNQINVCEEHFEKGAS